MLKPTLQDASDVIETLPEGDQDLLLEIVQRRRIERRRSQMARNAEETLQAVREGTASYGSLEDLKRNLLNEE